jgi:putative membrane-bound dehydrogenase-like protein
MNLPNLRIKLIGMFSLLSASLLHGQFAFHQHDGEMEITLDDKPVATYVWKDPNTTRPYFKHIRTPDGIQVSRNHPPKAADYQDHETYHPGIWWGFGDVGENDYWRMKARIIGGEFVTGPTGGRERATFAVKNRLLKNASDEVFVEQISHYTLLRKEGGILLIAESTFLPKDSDYWLGDQEEMGLAFRVQSDLAINRNQGSQILNANGSTDLKIIRTTQSDWADYSGPFQNKYAGMMLMSDPGNFRRPWWHAVNTGLLVANAFGESELNGQGKKRQSQQVPAGESFRIRYGVYIHAHETEKDLNRKAAYQDFIDTLKKVDSPTKRKPKPTASQLPQVPDGFAVSAFAREPLIFKPTAICFDSKGRLTIGQGPQYPHHHETFPTDSVYIVIDRDEDGVADEAKQFARGFNSVQGLAWKGNDLYVANAPELTVVRDLDGDDEADEYVIVYTDLGNREHALHGLNWGPDGKLYMSKGNSKGHNQPDKFPGVAPKAFRDLWDVTHPPGAPDSYPPQTYTKYTYKKSYHNSNDDWGRQGGVLRCDPLGANLEIVSRGLRNPWDMTMDDEFNWIGTDNDQNQGDRIFAPVFGTHFGWGHPYSNHWTGEDHLPTAPVSGPVFHGSGTGVIYYTHPHFPESYQNTFFINDWMHGTYVYRPTWEGALRMPTNGKWEPFARRGEDLYRPTDMEFGPDGTIYICGWGGDYHYQPGEEGSWVYRIQHQERPLLSRSDWFTQKYHVPYSQWTLEQLLDDLGHQTIPVWRVNAHDEIVRRGLSNRAPLIAALENGDLTQGQQTWCIWALGRMGAKDPVIGSWLTSLAANDRAKLNLRIQALRILTNWVRDGDRTDPLPDVVATLLTDTAPRLRLEAIQAIWQANQTHLVSQLIDWLPHEMDRLNYYSAWGALRDLTNVSYRKSLLQDQRPAVRLAALLGLFERFEISLEEALAVAEKDSDPQVQQWITTWALNPTPPKKMPNGQSRIEQEQSISVGDIIERTKSASSPNIRRLFLTMLSRATYEDNDEWNDVYGFYQTLDTDQERAQVVRTLSRESRAMPVLWKALEGSEPLSQAAIQGFVTLSNGARQTASDVANFLLEQLLASPKSPSSPGALETLARLRFIQAWEPQNGWDQVFIQQFSNTKDIRIQGRLLRALSKIDASTLSESDSINRLVESIAENPDPRLYQGLMLVSDKLGMEVSLNPDYQANLTGVMTQLRSASVERGRELFFSKTGATGCVMCHRIQGRGNNYAPDLSSIGSRANKETITESILSPSIAITEGFQLQLIESRNETTMGAVMEETASEIVIVRQDGTVQRIPRNDVTRREKLNQSAMPATYPMLGNEQIADLVAFLQTCQHPANEN